MIPRIQGRLGIIEEPVELKGKHTFEIFMSFMGQGEPEKIVQGPAYDTEAEALRQMREACRFTCEAIEIKMAGEVSGKFIDMKTNETRNWDEN